MDGRNFTCSNQVLRNPDVAGVFNFLISIPPLVSPRYGSQAAHILTPTQSFRDHAVQG